MGEVRDFKQKGPDLPEVIRQLCPECGGSFWRWFIWYVDGQGLNNMECAQCGWDDCAEEDEE